MLKKNILFCVILVVIFINIFLITNFSLAQFGLENFSSGSSNTFFSANRSVPETVTRIISIVIGVIGVLLLGLLIYGGILYATSAGGEQIDKAKKVLTYAIIGIVIVAISFAITNYVIVGLFSDDLDQANNGGSQINNNGATGNSGGLGSGSGEGENLILEGNDMITRGEVLRERGQQLIDDGNESAGRILIDDGEELINSGNERIEEGNAILNENQTIPRDNNENNRSTDAAPVDIDCKWVGEPCYLGGRVGQDCCFELECGGGIADTGLLWGACDRVE
jgi:hypothetical protein